jgi:predicted MFS family arabinose efflux permease
VTVILPGSGTPSALRATLSGLSASLVGIGLARFAYTPLIPALIAARWFDPAQAVYLGAANLAGYLAGALLAPSMAARAAAATILRVMMALATVAFFACAFPLSFWWFSVWRFASGLAGGALMALAAPTVLPHVPASRRGLAGGAIFTGVGLGIAASGTLVPLLLRLGLVETWFGLGALALALTVLAWGGWPAAVNAPGPAPQARLDRGPASLPVKALYAEYALNAFGLVPHMVFLVDFIARGLGRGIDGGTRYWVLFGLGAMVGPMFAGALADRIGFGPALRLAFAVQAAAVLVPAISTGPGALGASSLIIGAFVPGIVPLVLGRTHELIPAVGSARQAAWSGATTAFALGQATGAYGLSFLFARAGGYDRLFELGSTAIALALLIDLIAARGRSARRRASAQAS